MKCQDIVGKCPNDIHFKMMNNSHKSSHTRSLRAIQYFNKIFKFYEEDFRFSIKCYKTRQGIIKEAYVIKCD